ncbi:prolyl oligopeptidase family protein [Streptomyces sp. Ncost-T10-10d]|uniref:prolyl oligopeptidase family protein n=1 Tax=Streptomyces sp. Ncost-T10-10d TaxID=1839774 RepID=UPI00114D1F1F
MRHPDYYRALVCLSRDGGDAVAVRGFDLADRAFVYGGSRVGEAKTQTGWIGVRTVVIGTDFGPGSLTDAGHPRTVAGGDAAPRWKQPTWSSRPRQEMWRLGADTTRHHTTPGFEPDFVSRWLDFFRSEMYLLNPGATLDKVDVPDDSSACTHLRHPIVTLKSDWLGQRVGSLPAFDFDAFLAGDRTADVLYTRKSERLWPGTPGPATI